MKNLLKFLTKILVFITPKRFNKFVNYETVSYLFFGGLTTLVGLGFFVLFHYFVDMGVAAAGILSDVLAVIFAFFTNKIYVFESPSFSPRTFVPELLKFGVSRLLTIVLGILALVLLVDILGFNAMLMRLLTIVFIHVLGNYVLSKWIVFSGRDG
ncbi:MAG: GtrA family protein [Defluviitaleaceae bacterium]|nr:GtrA family protein [Defluviitaleaceae bacterium]